MQFVPITDQRLVDQWTLFYLVSLLLDVLYVNCAFNIGIQHQCYNVHGIVWSSGNRFSAGVGLSLSLVSGWSTC